MLQKQEKPFHFQNSQDQGEPIATQISRHQQRGQFPAYNQLTLAAANSNSLANRKMILSY